MKKIFIVLSICVIAMVACHKKRDTATTGQLKIGLAKIIAHPALDAIEQGIKDELAAQQIIVTFDSQNANGEMSTMAGIANKFKADKVDIAVGIATPTALALANQIKDVPVIFSGVTDPIGAGLRTTFTPEKGNIAGVSDMAPVKEQIKLIARIKDVKKIGHIYTPSEANSVTQMEMAKKACEELGIELLLSAVNNTAEVKQAAEVVAPKVDAIYVSNDNTVVAALAAVTETAYRYNIPVVSADPSSAEASNVTVAYGIDNYQTGRATGRLVAQIVRGAKPEELAVKLMSEPDELASYVNEAKIKELNLKKPF